MRLKCKSKLCQLKRGGRCNLMEASIDENGVCENQIITNIKCGRIDIPVGDKSYPVIAESNVLIALEQALKYEALKSA